MPHPKLTKLELTVVYRLARRVLLAGAGIVAIASPVVIGQAKADSLAFEVASVKPADPDSNRISMGYTPDGGLNFINVSLKDMIVNGYNIVCGKACDDGRISGGPKWLESARFDVQTKGPQLPQGAKATREQIRECVRTLLADRFKLVVRSEIKEMPVYHLVAAKNGHKLKEYTGEDQQGGIRGSRPGELIGERASLYGLVVNLTGMVGRPVIDKTGLTGRYDFRLEWTPDAASGGKGPGGPGEKMDVSSPELAGAPIFAALQDQLGLKLEPQRAPVEILVVLSAEKPSAN